MTTSTKDNLMLVGGIFIIVATTVGSCCIIGWTIAYVVRAWV